MKNFFWAVVCPNILLLLLVFGSYWCGCWWEKAHPRIPQTPPPPEELIWVTIIDTFPATKEQGYWALLQCYDGQRGYISYYRGKKYDRFRIAKKDVKGYHIPAPQKPTEPILDSPSINLEVTKGL